MNIVAVGIGPGSAQLLTLAAINALKSADTVILRTSNHGCTEYLSAQSIAFGTLDGIYDAAEDFDAFNLAAAEEILRVASEPGGTMCYGTADVSDNVVKLLMARAEISIILGVTNAAQGYSGTAYQSLSAIDIISGGYVHPRTGLIVTEIDCVIVASEVKTALLNVYPPEHTFVFFPPSAAVMRTPSTVKLYELDRQTDYDHTCCAYTAPLELEQLTRYDSTHLVEIMRRLRGENGCPWDAEQTHASLKQYLLEEAYEVFDAVDEGNSKRLYDELGDVLLQTVFHAAIGEEHGEFDFGDVTTAICAKLIYRHPHVFGQVKADTASDVLKNWEQLKQAENGHKTQAESLKSVPKSLSALMRAAKVQKKAAHVGFDWAKWQDALYKIEEEARELRESPEVERQGEMGDLLFACVNVARLMDIAPELALNGATDKFIDRFALMERAIIADGRQMQDMTLSEMDEYWDKVKHNKR